MTWSTVLKPNGLLEGRGHLEHHFWGEYHATIFIRFKDVAAARVAKRVLGRGWEVARYKESKKPAPVVRWFGKGEQLDKVLLVLAQYGAVPSKVASVKFSIDSGEPFVIQIPDLPPRNKARAAEEAKRRASYREMEQLSFFKA